MSRSVFVQALIEYLSLEPTLAVGAVFAAAFLATVGLIGTSLPGRSVMVATGVLIGLGAVDPWWGSIAVIAGVILGDACGYWVRRQCQGRLRTRSPRKQPTGYSLRVQKYFAERAGKSVLHRRFLSPERAILPSAAGNSRYRRLKFTLLNAFAAVAWLLAHLISGVMLGVLLRLAAAISSRLVVFLVVVAVMLVALVLLLRLSWRAFAPMIRRQRDGIVGWARAGSGILPRLVQSLLDPFRPESIGLLVASLMMLGGGWLFLEIVEAVVSQARLVEFDKVVFGTLQSLRTPLADRLMVVATQLGSVRVALPVIVVVALVLALARCWRTLAYWLTAVGFAQAMVWILKTTLGRSRPIAIYDGLERFSFPSGHAASAIVLYGFFAVLLGRGKPLLVRSALAATAMLLICLIAFSRLYLGAHWFSDVAASLSLGTTWIALLGIVYTQHVRTERLPSNTLAIAVLVVFVVAGGIVTTTHRAADQARYAPPAPSVPVLLDDWQRTGWLRLPISRSDADGEQHETLQVQWAAEGARIEGVLRADGWHTPVSWTMRTAATWLLPTVTAAQLPVLPKFHEGTPALMTFEKEIDAAHRRVVRFWNTDYRVDATDGSPTPLWIGMVTSERLERSLGIITLAHTDRDVATVTALFAASLRGHDVGVELKSHDQGATLLLR